MAKKKAAKTRTITKVVKAPTPVIKVQAPRSSAPAKRKRKGGGGRRRGSGTGNLQKTMMGAAAGGAVLGYIEQKFPNLPTIPVVGRKGTIAIIAYIVAGKTSGMVAQLAREAAVATAAVAGYELGKDGQITGDVMGDIAPQVSGVAAQV